MGNANKASENANATKPEGDEKATLIVPPSSAAPISPDIDVEEDKEVEEVIKYSPEGHRVRGKKAVRPYLTRADWTHPTFRQRTEWQTELYVNFVAWVRAHLPPAMRTFWEAVRAQDAVATQRAIELHGDRIDLEARVFHSGTALQEAVYQYYGVEVVEVLLTARANVNTRDELGRTTLHCASDAGKVRLLLDAHADVLAQDKDGNTVLHRRSDSSEAKVAALIDGGASPALPLKNNQGDTAAMWAIRCDHPQSAKLIEQAERTPPLCRLWRKLRAGSHSGNDSTVDVCVLACAPLANVARRLLFAMRQCNVAVRCPRFDHHDLFESAEAEAELRGDIAIAVRLASHTVVVVDNRLNDLRLFAQQRLDGLAAAQLDVTVVVDVAALKRSDPLSDVVCVVGTGMAETASLLFGTLRRCCPVTIMRSLEQSEVKRWMYEFDSQLLARECEAAGTEPSTRVKLSVIGNAAAGKTTLVELLRTQQAASPAVHRPTELVTVNKFELGGMTWVVQDFPGQQEFYGTNLSFMSCEQALFLIVVDLTLSGVLLELQLKAWLSSLALLVSHDTLGFKPKPPKVLIVGTHRDLLKEKDRSRFAVVSRLAGVFRDELEVLSLLTVSCREEKDVLTLLEAVKMAGRALCHGSAVPKSLVAIRYQIDQIRARKWLSLETARELLSTWLRVERAMPQFAAVPVVVPTRIVPAVAAPRSVIANNRPRDAVPELPPSTEVKQVSKAKRDGDGPPEEQLARVMSVETLLETQGDLLKLDVADTLTLVVVDPPWFAQVMGAAVQPNDGIFRGLHTDNGVVTRPTLEQALLPYITSLEPPPTHKHLTAMHCLFALLLQTQVCYALKSSREFPASDTFLIPSRVQRDHLSLNALHACLKPPLFAVRLSYPDKCVMPPGLFAFLMCALRPPVNHADDAGMFAQREFVLLDKHRSTYGVLCVDPSDRFLDLIIAACGTQSASADRTEALLWMRVRGLLTALDAVKNNSRWSGLRWQKQWLCFTCVSQWSVLAKPVAVATPTAKGFPSQSGAATEPLSDGLLRGAMCPPQDFHDSAPEHCTCLKHPDKQTHEHAPAATGETKSMEQKPSGAQFSAPFSAGQDEVALLTLEALIDRMDHATVHSDTMRAFVNRLLSLFPDDPQLNACIDASEVLPRAAAWWKAGVKRWLFATVTPTGVPFATIAHAWHAVTATGAAAASASAKPGVGTN